MTTPKSEETPRYKNLKGDLEKKRLKAKENLAKGRAKRMENLKHKKENPQLYDIQGPEDDDSSSEESGPDQELVFRELPKTPTKKTKKARVTPPIQNPEAGVHPLILKMFAHLEKKVDKVYRRGERRQPIPPPAPPPPQQQPQVIVVPQGQPYPFPTPPQAPAKPKDENAGLFDFYRQNAPK